MKCLNCSQELEAEVTQCNNCGFAVQADEVKTKKVTSKKVTLAFILSTTIFIGLISGIYGAYYISKNGWEAVPFAKHLAFIPIVDLPNETEVAYTVQPKLSEEDENTKEEERDEISSEQAMSSETLEDAAITETTLESPTTVNMVNDDGSYWIQKSESELKHTILSFQNEEQLLSITEYFNNGDFSTKSLTAEVIPYTMLEHNIKLTSFDVEGSVDLSSNILTIPYFSEQQSNFVKVTQPPLQLSGHWYTIIGNQYEYISFNTEDLSGEVKTVGQSENIIPFSFTFDGNLLAIQVESTSIPAFQTLDLSQIKVEMVGDYLVLSSTDSQLIVMKKLRN